MGAAAKESMSAGLFRNKYIEVHGRVIPLKKLLSHSIKNTNGKWKKRALTMTSFLKIWDSPLHDKILRFAQDDMLA